MTPKHYEALAKMLPEKVQLRDNEVLGLHLAWKNSPPNHAISYTELLHLCWLVECQLNEDETCSWFNSDWSRWQHYEYELNKLRVYADKKNKTDHWTPLMLSTPEQRIEALAKVKGIEI